MVPKNVKLLFFFLFLFGCSPQNSTKNSALKYDPNLLVLSQKVAENFDQKHGTLISKKASATKWKGPDVLVLFDKEKGKLSDELRALLKRPDSVAFVSLPKNPTLPRALISIPVPEGWKYAGSQFPHILGRVSLSSLPPSCEACEKISIPKTKTLVTKGQQIIILGSQKCSFLPRLYKLLSSIPELKTVKNISYLDLGTPLGKTALERGGFTTALPALLFFEDGKLTDYVLRAVGEREIRHALFRNKIIDTNPGLETRWKSQFTQPEILRSITGGGFQSADLSELNLQNARFKGQVLSGTQFKSSDLNGADFRNSFLFHVDFRDALLAGANFENAMWKHTICPDGTSSNDHKNNCPASTFEEKLN